MSYFTYQSKRIYYTEKGHGDPTIFLHGNTASSKMFEFILPFYQNDFKIILIDFLGHGQSDSLDIFPITLWYEESLQVIALIEHLQYKKVNLIGTSGGAYVAINVALQRPDLIDKIVADSFNGCSLNNDFSDKLLKERAFAKNDPLSQQYFNWLHGNDWEKIIDLDTQSLLAFINSKSPIFSKPLNHLTVPTLLLGSHEDAMLTNNLEHEYKEIQKITPESSIHLFDTGEHPAIISNAETASIIIQHFLKK